MLIRLTSIALLSWSFAMTKPYRPVALIIMDGWGIREMAEGNAVVLGDTPNYDRWNREHERTVLDASGEPVGLPEGQMGNSEVGHLNLGAGRIVYQDLTRINLAIRDNTFDENQTLQETLNGVKARNGKLHLIGLLGDGGVHSYSGHLYALLESAKRNQIEPIIHLISDGRDTPQQSALGFAEALESYLETNPGVIASICGRYYTMDRDKRWERTEKGYRVIVHHEGEEGAQASSASAALQASYAEGISDEFLLPVAIDVGDRDVQVEAGDCLLFTNFRADRLRQLVTTFLEPDFDGFEQKEIANLQIVTMTQYSESFGVPVLFPDVEIVNPLAEVLSKAGLQQFHAAETEKYAHVTYFFNGGKEQQFAGEERHLEPSPKVATYDLQPEMSAQPLLDALLQRIADHDDDFILVNFANPDMVGHTGSLEAAIKAVETVDRCAGELVQAITDKGGIALVTADHGNCERMLDLETGKPHTYHTTQPVALFVIGDGYRNLRARGKLADVAPTILDLMGVAQPTEMSGESLLME